MEVFASLAAFSQPDLPWQFVVGVFITTTALIVVTRRRAARPRSASLRRKLTLAEDSPSSQRIQGDLREVMIELENLARQVNAQIETKYLKLEKVIRDADTRIAELERLRVEAQADASDSGPATTAMEGEKRRPSLDPQGVANLRAAGHSVAAIARRVGRSPSEIDLVLALHEQAAGVKH